MISFASYGRKTYLRLRSTAMTYALDLDPDFRPTPTLDRLAAETFRFAGGEPHVKLPADAPVAGARVVVSQRARSWDDLGLLAVAVDALRRAGAVRVELVLPYFPGARQDRVMVPGEPLTVKVYADFVNALALDAVTIYDPHSSVAPALLDRVRVVDNVGFAGAVLRQLPAETVLVAPDAGAQKKVYHVAAALGGRAVVEAGKRRDVRTGALSGFHVYADALAGAPCLVLDDICDGGGTFLGLAGALRDAGAGDLYLAVSHGIFSRGLDALAGAYRRVYCTDAFATTPPHPALTQVPLAGLLPADAPAS